MLERRAAYCENHCIHGEQDRSNAHRLDGAIGETQRWSLAPPRKYSGLRDRDLTYGRGGRYGRTIAIGGSPKKAEGNHAAGVLVTEC
jgi:hypothetical protein